MWARGRRATFWRGSGPRGWSEACVPRRRRGASPPHPPPGGRCARPPDPRALSRFRDVAPRRARVYHGAKCEQLKELPVRRVVVTGLGMVTPLASGVEATWERLLAGKSGAGPITRFDASQVVTKYACEIPVGDGSDGTFNPDDWMEPKDRRKVDDFILYGVAAAHQAVLDAGWMPDDEESRLRTGVMIGSGIGGLTSIAETAVLIKERGPKRVSPFFIPGALINLISGQVSIRYGFKGPNHAVVTACSTGAHAIGDASRMIRYGRGRRGKPDQRDRHRGLQRLQGLVDQAGG